MLAHEISHVRNRDILISSVAAAVAMGITFLARMAMWGAMFGGGGRDRNDNVLGTLALAILAPIAAMFLQMALSRSREYEADRRGAELLGTGEPLASALEKLDRGTQAHARARSTRRRPAPTSPTRWPGRRRQFSARFASTHPPMEDRIAPAPFRRVAALSRPIPNAWVAGIPPPVGPSGSAPPTHPGGALPRRPRARSAVSPGSC